MGGLRLGQRTSEIAEWFSYTAHLVEIKPNQASVPATPRNPPYRSFTSPINPWTTFLASPKIIIVLSYSKSSFLMPA
jgi:hypothetical protein